MENIVKITPKRTKNTEFKTRYQIIRDLVDCGLEIPSEKDTVITDWTPNNVKRIVLSVMGVIIEFHTSEVRAIKTARTGATKLRIKAFSEAVYENDKNTYLSKKHTTPLLNVLGVNASEKSLSMVEEIIYCMGDSVGDAKFNEYALKRDLEPILQLQGIETKLPRLRKVSKMNISIKELSALMQKGLFAGDKTVAETVQGKIQVAPIININNPEWYNATRLRGAKYEEDERVLRGYFEKIKEDKAEEAQKLERLTKNYEKLVATLTKGSARINYITDLIRVYAEEFEIVKSFNKEWAFRIHEPEILAKVKDNLAKDGLLEEVQGIRFKLLYQLMSAKQADAVNTKDYVCVVDIHKTLFGEIESKMSLEDSIYNLKRFIDYLFKQITYSGYEVYLGYLSSVDDNMLKDYWYLLGKDKPHNVKFTRDISKQIDREITYREKNMCARTIKQLGEEGNYSIVDELTDEEIVEESIRLTRAVKLYTLPMTYTQMKRGY